VDNWSNYCLQSSNRIFPFWKCVGDWCTKVNDLRVPWNSMVVKKANKMLDNTCFTKLSTSHSLYCLNLEAFPPQDYRHWWTTHNHALNDLFTVVGRRRWYDCTWRRCYDCRWRLSSIWHWCRDSMLGKNMWTLDLFVLESNWWYMIVGISWLNECCIHSRVNTQRPKFNLASIVYQDGMSPSSRMKETFLLKMRMYFNWRVHIWRLL